MNSIAKLLQTNKTVFTIKELAFLWGNLNQNALKRKVLYYTTKGRLIRVKRGIFYLKARKYNQLELANKYLAPSYISFETVFYQEGINFQWESQTYLAATRNIEVNIEGNIYIYRRLRKEILLNTIGLKFKENYIIATKERAVLDMLYYMKEGYHFDNLDSLDFDLMYKIIPIYNSNILLNRLNKIKKYVESNKT